MCVCVCLFYKWQKQKEKQQPQQQPHSTWNSFTTFGKLEFTLLCCAYVCVYKYVYVCVCACVFVVCFFVIQSLLFPFCGQIAVGLLVILVFSALAICKYILINLIKFLLGISPTLEHFVYVQQNCSTGFGPNGIYCFTANSFWLWGLPPRQSTHDLSKAGCVAVWRWSVKNFSHLHVNFHSYYVKSFPSLTHSLPLSQSSLSFCCSSFLCVLCQAVKFLWQKLFGTAAHKKLN